MLPLGGAWVKLLGVHSDARVRRRSSSGEVAVALGRVPRRGHVREAAGGDVGAAPAGLRVAADVHVVEGDVLAGLGREADQVAGAAGVHERQVPEDDISDLGADRLRRLGARRA